MLSQVGRRLAAAQHRSSIGRASRCAARVARAAPATPSLAWRRWHGAQGRSIVSAALAHADAAPRTTPTEEVLATWRRADAVCFDVDCTITVNDSLDLLAEFMGCKDEVEALTNQAMDGSLNLEQALEKRLDIINCTPEDIKRFMQAYPPQSRLVPRIREFIASLQARGKAVYLISGGFRELILPIAALLGVPKDRVFANRMNWQWDDETGMPTKLVGFDLSEPTAHNQGKPQAIARIRQKQPYQTIVMIGDGITDLEAVQISGGADLFIGFGGVVERPAVAAQADWFVRDYADLIAGMKRYKIACVGSGAWACAALRMVAQNAMANDPADEFEDAVTMWVYDEPYDGKKLTEVINERHENPRYLPGVDLGPNVVAEPDLVTAVAGADLIIICAPHQFIHSICKQLAGKVKPDAAAISLTKGMRVRMEGPQLITAMVRKYLGLDCCVLMGANIAGDIAKEQLSEAVIGYTTYENALVWQKVFTRPYFKIELSPDPVGAEMCGTLKNVVAVAAGMVDGLGYGPNSKAAILRQGLNEMRELSKALYPTVRDETFLMSCGVADLIATCYGGRNRLVAEAWTRARLSGKPTSFEALEKELLSGQKLQGVLTSDEVQAILRARGWEARFPLFTTVNRIIHGHLEPAFVFRCEEGAAFDIKATLSDSEDLIPKPRKPDNVAAVIV